MPCASREFIIFLRSFARVMTSDPALAAYTQVWDQCKHLFTQKNKDYGEAWRFLRPVSLLDQIYLKAFRIRTVQEKGKQVVADSLSDDFKGIINYGVLAWALEAEQLPPSSMGQEMSPLSKEQLLTAYDACIAATTELFLRKNHDYGAVWQQLSCATLVDIVLMKIDRLRNMYRNQKNTLVSEGVTAGYMDIINYAIFALINEGGLA